MRRHIINTWQSWYETRGSACVPRSSLRAIGIAVMRTLARNKICVCTRISTSWHHCRCGIIYTSGNPGTKTRNLSLLRKPAFRAIAASGNPGTKNDVFLYQNHHFVAAVPAASYITRGSPGTKQENLRVYQDHHFVPLASSCERMVILARNTMCCLHQNHHFAASLTLRHHIYKWQSWYENTKSVSRTKTITSSHCG